MKIYLDNNLGVTNVEQEELTQDTIGYNILKVYIPNAVLTPYDTFTCYYGALLQNGRKVGWFAMEARTSSDADYKANYTLYKATLEQCVVSVEGKVYIGCQVLLGNSGNATLIKKNTAVVQFNVRKSVAINNDILVLDTDQTTTDVLESYKNLLENALTTYATKATTYTKTEVNSALALKADKSDTYTKTEVDVKDLNLAAQMASDKLELNNRINTTDGILTATQAEVAKLKSVQNVVEVVATKSALNSYDTTKLDVNDKVQVIADETHDGASTIYNWSGSAWQYVGAFGGNSYTKQESDNKFALKSTAVAHDGNQLKDNNGNNIYPTLEDGQIEGEKLNLLSVSNIPNLASNNCGNITTATATAFQEYVNYRFNIEQGKTYLVCAMFKKNANHTDTVGVAMNLRFSGTTYNNYTNIIYKFISSSLTTDYQFVYRVFTANENKSDYFGAYFYRYSNASAEKVVDIDVKSMFVCELPNKVPYQFLLESINQKNYISNLDYLSCIDKLYSLFNDMWDDKTVLCYGDSLTQGAGGSGTTYPSVLQSLLGSDYYVSNRGVGGENALQIGARQGGVQAMIQPMTIGASYANCEVKSIIDDISIKPLGLQSSADQTINPVNVNGHECTIYFTSSTQCIIKSNSTSFTIDRPVPLLTASTKAKHKTLLLWVGQNGFGDSDNQTLINIIRNMIEYNNNNRYLVIGLSTGTTSSRAELEADMVRVFGNHYINIRKYLVTYGLDDNSLTPTAQDTTDISNGTVPTSLRSDGVHLNAYGYTSVAKCVYQYGKNNNLW